MLSKRSDFIVFLFIFIVAYFQSKYIGFYHDDYGYAALSYGVRGNYPEFSMYNVILFIKDHYVNWGGRVLFFFFEVLALQLDMQGFMFVQSIIVAITIFFTYKTILSIIDRDDSRLKVFILLSFIGIYLLFAKKTYANALFWASASVLYVWPLCPMMIGIYLFIRWYIKKEMSFCRLLMMGIVFFYGCFFSRADNIGSFIYIFFIFYLCKELGWL